jgi:lipopolysaccharide/colanic/teichoic acid biosynthesis glycosyltransferase
MSLIGPRPEDPRFVAMHQDEYRHILSVRPGLTGLSQLAYKEEQRILDDSRPVEDYVMRIMPQKLTLDTLYADRNRPTLDLRVVFWTVMTVIVGKPVAVNRKTGRMNVRRRKQPWTAEQRAQHHALQQLQSLSRSDRAVHESAA